MIMPEKKLKTPGSILGSYYVDTTCTDCDLCRSTAPRFFTRHEESGNSYVYRQPVTVSEIAEAEAARMECPTESIGNDG